MNMSELNEKIFKVMKGSGTASLIVGILMICLGLVAGIICIVNGALLLRQKTEITF